MLKAFKDLIGIEDIEEEDIEEEEIEEVVKEKEKKQEKNNSFTVPRTENKDSKKTVAQSSKSVVSATLPFKMVIIEPKDFDECQKLVDNLKAKKPVIINLEKVETKLAQKMFDFLNGAIYALGGDVKKVANNIFVFAPENVDITAKKHTDEMNVKEKSLWR